MDSKILTKKDLLALIDDFPDDAKICLGDCMGYCDVAYSVQSGNFDGYSFEKGDEKVDVLISVTPAPEQQ